MKNEFISNIIWLCVSVLLLIASLISKNLWVASFGLVIFMHSVGQLDKLWSKRVSASVKTYRSEIESKFSKFLFKIK